MSSSFTEKVWLPWILRRQAKSGRPLSMEEIRLGSLQRILVISSTAIGDTLMSTPAIKALRQRYPSAHLAVLMHRRQVPMFRDQPHIDQVISLGRFPLITGLLLHSGKYDAAIILHGNEPESTLLAFMSGARVILKFPYGHPFPQCLSTRGEFSDYDPFTEHAITSRLKLVALLDAKSKDPAMTLGITKDGRILRRLLLRGMGVRKGETLIGFQLGAAKPYKVWPLASFVDLAKKILAAWPEVKILLLGSNNERHLSAGILAEIENHRVVDLAGRMKIQTLPAVVEKLDLLVTNDTGTMHVAVALKRPTISLFGPTETWGVGPIQDPELHTLIKKPIPCDPCITKSCEQSPPECMAAITVEEVFAAVRTRLDGAES